MSNGRVSRLYRALVRDQKIAAYAAGFSGLPGTKYAHLFAFYGVPLPGHTNDELRDAIHKQIDLLKTTDITDEELAMFKTRSKADLIRSLSSNEGLAQALATYQTRYGDWRELFRYLDRVDKVTKADVRRVANKVFTDTNRTTGEILTAQQPASKEGMPACRRRNLAATERIAERSAIMLTRRIHRVLWLCCFALLAVSLGVAQVKEWNQIQAPPLPAFTPPEPIRVQLANGMVIFLQPDHELPLISATPRFAAAPSTRLPTRRAWFLFMATCGALAAPGPKPATRWTTSSKRVPPRLKPPGAPIRRPSPSTV